MFFGKKYILLGFDLRTEQTFGRKIEKPLEEVKYGKIYWR